MLERRINETVSRSGSTIKRLARNLAVPALAGFSALAAMYATDAQAAEKKPDQLIPAKSAVFSHDRLQPLEVEVWGPECEPVPTAQCKPKEYFLIPESDIGVTPYDSSLHIFLQKANLRTGEGNDERFMDVMIQTYNPETKKWENLKDSRGNVYHVNDSVIVLRKYVKPGTRVRLVPSLERPSGPVYDSNEGFYATLGQPEPEPVLVCEENICQQPKPDIIKVRGKTVVKEVPVEVLVEKKSRRGLSLQALQDSWGTKGLALRVLGEKWGAGIYGGVLEKKFSASDYLQSDHDVQLDPDSPVRTHHYTRNEETTDGFEAALVLSYAQSLEKRRVALGMELFGGLRVENTLKDLVQRAVVEYSPNPSEVGTVLGEQSCETEESSSKPWLAFLLTADVRLSDSISFTGKGGLKYRLMKDLTETDPDKQYKMEPDTLGYMAGVGVNIRWGGTQKHKKKDPLAEDLRTKLYGPKGFPDKQHTHMNGYIGGRK